MNLYMHNFGLKLSLIFLLVFIDSGISQISATRDNTLYEDPEGTLSNGAGEHFFAGLNNNGGILRGLIAFDLAEEIPANATITSVTLTLNMSRTRAGTETIFLHRVESDWGEGTSAAAGEEGGGAAATTTDATWIHTFYDTDSWTNAGGDYNADPSASTAVAGNGRYSWGSNENMIADVQAWIENPDANYGWILIGNENGEQTAKRFDSKDNANAANRPVLNIEYTVPNESPVAVNDLAVTDEDNNVNINVLANDSDDGSLDASTVTIVSQPSNGSVTNINANTGVITYSPDNDFNGSETFSYTVDDDQGATSNEATVNVTVNSINDAPTASNDNAVTNEDNGVIVNVLGNDEDIDGTLIPSTVTISDTPDNGSITSINESTGAITYMPDADYNGSDSFTYTVEDDSGSASNAATVTITINALNDPPTAVNDTTATDEDQSVSVSVLSNDIDGDGLLVAATVNVVDTPDNGSITNINTSSGAITYMPSANYTGNDSFTYTVEDDSGAVSNQATVLISINPVNDAPVANDDEASTNEDNAVIIAVLDNDSDPDGNPDPSTVSVTGDPSNGTIININTSTGEVTYQPAGNFYGMDSFTYTFEDNGGLTSSEATVSVTVFSVNDPPVANDDETETDEETSVQLNILLNDSDIDGSLNTATISITNDPVNGAVTDINTLNGVITYLPDNNFNGEDSFTYTVQDDSSAISNEATVTINVNTVNDAPVAVNDQADTDEDNSVVIDVLENDSDADGTLDAATVIVVNNPSNGTITNINTSTGEITYSPANNYHGLDAFTYRVQDNNLANSNQATVSLTIFSVNDAPVAQNDAANTEENQSVIIEVLSNDSDIDGTLNVSSVNVVDAPQDGAAVVEEDGRISYTPDDNFNGNDALTYTVTDDSGAVSNQATVSISVGAVNDLPVAVADIASVNEDDSTQIDILSNDFDTDGIIIPSTVSIINNPQNGIISTINPATGVVTYVPNANFFGIDNFSYTVNDDSNATSSQTQVTVTVHSVNDAPVANDDDAQTTEEIAVVINILENDQDTDGTLLTTSIVTSNPANGSITNIDAESGVVTYMPEEDFTGSDQFTYTVEDDSGAVSNQATVTVDVSNTNDAPVVSGAPFISFNEDDSLQVLDNIWYEFISDNETADSVLNIQFFDGSFIDVQKIGHLITFSAPANWFGLDTLVVIVSDGQLTGQAPFSVSVNSINDAPYFVLLPDSIEFFNDQTFDIPLNEFVMDDDLPQDNLDFQFNTDNDSLLIELNEETNVATVSAPGFSGSVMLDIIVTDDSLAAAEQTVVVNVMNVVTGIEDIAYTTPEKFSLSQNFPNPFNPITRIKYQLPQNSHVSVKVYDVKGREVATLVNHSQAAGEYSVNFNGSMLASGIYFYRIKAGKYVKIKRMLLIK